MEVPLQENMLTEYNVKVGSFSDLPESPHSWDKKVLNISPIKSGSNYRFRLGLQMFRMKTNESYSLIVELYNPDYGTWQRQKRLLMMLRCLPVVFLAPAFHGSGQITFPSFF